MGNVFGKNTTDIQSSTSVAMAGGSIAGGSIAGHPITGGSIAGGSVYSGSSYSFITLPKVPTLLSYEASSLPPNQFRLNIYH